MNFTTFTGSSRRPRNVNLSGQPSNPNPFAASSWARPGDPSRTVEQAQAERQQRQRERERLQGAKKIQRVYRGSLARAGARELHRARFDAVYAEESTAGAADGAADRVDRALPHLLRAFRLANKGDVDRLSRLCGDLAVVGVGPLAKQSPFRIIQFLDDLLDVLDLILRTDPLPEAPSCLDIITPVVQEFAGVVLVAKTAARLFSLLGRVSSREGLNPLWASATVRAIVAPFEVFRASKGKSCDLVPRFVGFADVSDNPCRCSLRHFRRPTQHLPSIRLRLPVHRKPNPVRNQLSEFPGIARPRRPHRSHNR